MQKYFRLVKLFWGTAIAAEMEYRLNFVIATLNSVGYQIGSLFTLYLFYRNGYSFAGWRWEESIMVLGIFTILQGFANTFLAPNLNQIVKQVEQGTLDFVLLKPISSQFWLSTHRLSPWGFPDLFVGSAIVLYAGNRLGLPPTAYLAAIPSLIFGFMILYSLWFMLSATSIWFTKIYNITEVLKGLLEAGRYPIVAYPMGYRLFFTFVVPVVFLTTVPTEAILGRVQLTSILGGGLLAIILVWASNKFWRFALKFYTSASS
jgi:ABC-2 type transport system permease protein